MGLDVRTSVTRLFVAIGATLSIGCPDDGPEEPRPTVQVAYRGTLTGTNDLAGVLELRVEEPSAQALRPVGSTSRPIGPTSPFAVTGSVRLNVPEIGSIELTGTFDAATGNASFSGSAFGGTLSFTGTLVDGVLSGPFTSTWGNGWLVLTREALGLSILCGHFDGTLQGRWSLYLSGDRVGGVFAARGGPSGLLAGTFSGAELQLQVPPSGGARGTVADGSVTGTWSDGAGHSGTFQASEAGCITLPPPVVLLPATPARTYVIPHFVERRGKVADTQYTFDTVIDVTYADIDPLPRGAGAAFDLYLFDSNGQPLRGAAREVCAPCHYEIGGTGGDRSLRILIEDLIEAAGGFEREVALGMAFVVVDGADPDPVLISGQIVNGRSGPSDVSATPLFVERADSGGGRHILPHLVERRGRTGDTQFTFDTALYAVYTPGLAGLPADLGAQLDLYLLDAEGTGPLRNNGEDVCAPCSFPIGGPGVASRLSLDLESLIAAKGGSLDADVKHGMGIIALTGADPGGVLLGGYLANSHTGPFDVSITPLPISRDRDGGGRRILPHVIEMQGRVASTQHTFDSTLYLTYTPGDGGEIEGLGAAVDLYLFDNQGRAPLRNHGEVVCNPCTFQLGGRDRPRRIAVSIEELVLARGGSFDTPTKLASAIVITHGADPGEVNFGGLLAHSHTGPLDLDISPLFIERDDENRRSVRVLPFVAEQRGRVTNTQFTLDSTLFATYTPGTAGETPGPGVRLDLYLYDARGQSPMTNGGRAVCQPCSFAMGGPNGDRKLTINIEERITATGAFEGVAKRGMGILVLSGDPDAVAITGFGVNARSGPSDLSFFPLAVLPGPGLTAPPPVDAGVPPDAGTPADAGAPADTGVVIDAGVVDAGEPSAPVPILTLDSVIPQALVVADDTVYVSELLSSTVYAVETDGTSPRPLTSTPQFPATGGLAVLDGRVYFSTYEVGGSTDGVVSSVPITGGTRTADFVLQRQPQGMASDGTFLFWAEGANDTIYRYTPGVPVPLPLAGEPGPGAVTVGGGFVYWTNSGQATREVRRAPTTLVGPQTILDNSEILQNALGAPRHLVVDGPELYVAVSPGSGGGGNVLRKNADGTGQVGTPALIADGASPSWVGVDGSWLYFSSQSTFGLYRVPKGGHLAVPQVVLSPGDHVGPFTFHGAHVFYAVGDTVYRAPKP